MTRLQTYFVAEENWRENEVSITEDAHHIIRVMRYNIGDQIICVHPDRKMAKCVITELNKQDGIVRATIIEWLDVDNELPVNVTILQSLPKGNKLEFIIQKGTELGASRFFLFASERSIVKWDEKKVKNRLERYEKIAKEASEQAKRNMIPEILYVENLHDLLDNLNDVKGSKLIAYEDEAKREPSTSLATQLKNVETNGEILVAIGPEGGFSEDEVKLFQNNGFVPVRLGKRILRTETAPLYVLSAISYHFEELE